jgi:dihydroorotate dehydrogenase
MVRRAAALLPADRVLVATGGVDTVDRAWQMLRHADLVGVYTGLVFRGPGLLRELRDGVAGRLRAEGLPSLAALRAPQRASVPA